MFTPSENLKMQYKKVVVIGNQKKVQRKSTIHFYERLKSEF